MLFVLWSVLLAGTANPRSILTTHPAAAAESLWVDSRNGDDSNDGLSPDSAFRTIQRAAETAVPGTTVHILPGVYRETVTPANDGEAGVPVVYTAENGPGTVVIRGSEPSSSLTWHRLTQNVIGLPDHVDPTDIFFTDLSAWNLSTAPRFVVQLNGAGEVDTRLPLAREPDWHVVTDWRYHELWWTADGGSEVAQCDPSSNADWNCDLPSRCSNQLTDRNVFPEPDPRIEAGNLTTLDDLTGARLISMDAKWGHYVYRRRIMAHEVAAGRITVEGQCLQDGGESDPGLGWGSKYYVEDHPALLDSPGEWWYDESSGHLYFWPAGGVDPATLDIEISRRSNGVDLTNRSHVTLDGLTIELVNINAVKQGWGPGTAGNTVRGATLRYADYGVVVLHSGDGVTRDFTLEDSEIAYIDTNALFISEWWDGAPTPTTGWQPSTENIVIRGNEFHHLGFRTDMDNAIGIKIQFANELRFEDNFVHDVAHNGAQFLWSVILSDRSFDFSPEEIRTGQILVRNNVFEDVCQLTTDCAALKFWGQPPDNHVFRDVLVTGNVFRDNLAWTYVSQQREGWWIAGEGCQMQGQAGFGLYLDYASGIHAYRNIAYNNAYAGFMLAGTWRDGDVIFYDNVVANSLYGFRPSGVVHDTHGGSVNTQIVNNTIVGNEGYGIYQCTADEDFGNSMIDHNLYYGNGWRSYEDGGVWMPGAMAIRVENAPQQYYPTVSDMQQHPLGWEMHGVEGDPAFQRYDPNDHNVTDRSWPDFHLTPASDRAVDAGAPLPASLVALLEMFAVDDPRWGPAYDIGRYEGSLIISATPQAQRIEPGEAAVYVVSVESVGGFESPVTIDAARPDPRFELTLDPTSLSSPTDVVLTLADRGGTSGLWYAVPITLTNGQFTWSEKVDLLVGGAPVYLPLILRN
jgi:hypothetical protein